MKRLYILLSVNVRGVKTPLAGVRPMTHEQACTMLGKFSPHPLRTIELEEVPNSIVVHWDTQAAAGHKLRPVYVVRHAVERSLQTWVNTQTVAEKFARSLSPLETLAVEKLLPPL